jgi:pyruvate formate lyase activating enzyme
VEKEIVLLDIQRMSSEDGPGLRTTAFLKGCPLACRWCHNPESISFNGQVLWHGARCMACGLCQRLCPQKGIHAREEGLELEREKCTGCFTCADSCPAAAMEAKGKKIKPARLCRELLKDRAYFGADGGVTLSGGEALMQEAAVELLQLLKEQGSSVAVDTCGLVPTDRLSRALAFCDIMLYDIKIADPARHKEYTGADNRLILENLGVVMDWAKKGGRLWIRTPLIPGATDDEENIRAIGEILAGYGTGEAAIPERWELCAFNNLCAEKYCSLGLVWAYDGTPLLEREHLDALAEIAAASGCAKTIKWTGAARTK